ncbi:VTT domain-containing protein [Paraburkholderia pallida]|uniref:Phosphoesterase n=1 Tax=Paraburkholderia pallida TaxID=2547399 RepID=A0A4P7D0D4_9BURK|nr:VTT domain-containing protein [Paraburkholderia pallida]QBR00557.1 phosphoesterase [Paraburkholderia pallida]
MEHAYVQLLHLLADYPGWTLAFVVFAAFTESLALVGTFFPGSTAMFIAGAFAGTGTLNLGWLFACAIAGAVAGDALSFWLGRRYRDSIAQIWPFSHYPAILEKAQSYFESHGTRSVILARFVAPLRAVVPVVAGMAGMSPMRFFVMNVISALVWAPAHIVPGVVFGASLQLAGAVSFRLVVALAMIVLAGWLVWRVTHMVLGHVDAWASASRRAAARWAAGHRGQAARRLARALDPQQPALGALLAVTALVPVCAAVFSYVLSNLLHGAPLVQIDQSVRQFFHSIHTTWADDVLAHVETLGSNYTLAALVATVSAWMALERRWRTIGYWALAAGVSQALILVLRFAIHHNAAGAAHVGAYVFPSDRVASMVIVYGFAMFLLVRRVNMAQAAAVATVGNAIVVAVTFAGLYFERFLFSDAIGGAAFASIWVGAVVMLSLWRYPQRPAERNFMPSIVLAVLALALVLQRGAAEREAALASRSTVPPVAVTQLAWTDSLWRTFACYRIDMKGERREPMTIQWAASASDLRAALRDAGWSEGVQFSLKSVLSLVAPNVDVLSLPLMPKLNNGLPSPLVFERAHLPGNPTRPGSRRDVLRFWPTGYAIERHAGAAADGHAGASEATGASETAAASGATRATMGMGGPAGAKTPAPSAGGADLTPIWVGSLVHERLRRASWPFNVLTTYIDNADYADNAGDSGNAGHAGKARNAGPDLAAPGQPTGWHAVTMPGSEGCEGRSVTLIVSGAR